MLLTSQVRCSSQTRAMNHAFQVPENGDEVFCVDAVELQLVLLLESMKPVR